MFHTIEKRSKGKIKNLFILGDSYSTFEGYIPDGYACYYYSGQCDTDVVLVEDTWWNKLMQEKGFNLYENNSWAGSTICYTGYFNEDCSETNSFIARIEKLDKEGFFDKNVVDTVIVLGGTNDSWANSPLGKVKYDNFVREDLYQILPAVSYLISRLQGILPKAQLIFVMNCDIKMEIIKGIKDICQYYGILCAELKGIDKANGHPTVLGMSQIKEQICKHI